VTVRIVAVFGVAMAVGCSVFAQAPAPPPSTAQYVDAVNGLTLEQVIAHALAQEPSLRSARTQVDVAESMRRQAGLRRNPTASFEQRDEPAGSDNQTTIGMEWPLDLFRRDARVGVAEREVTAVQSAVADRERLLRSEVRTRYGQLLTAIRGLRILDELVATTRRQYEQLRSRVEAGTTPALEQNLLDVELRRLEADRLLQVGRTDAASFNLKRALGMRSDDTLTVRDTLEGVVQRESAPTPTPGSSTVLDQRADVLEAASRVAVADAKINQAGAEGRFDMSLFFNYMRMDAGFPQRGISPGGSLEPIRGLFHYVSAGAMVSLPVLNRNQGGISAAKAERAGAAAAYEAARLTADAEVAAARAVDERARQAVTAYASGAQSLARQNLTVVTQSYELGRLTVFDVLAEQRRYLDVERAYTETLTAAYDARTALNRALGGVR
jgi:cobalt-zinc-cadmium efflux system outer membrane protein